LFRETPRYLPPRLGESDPGFLSSGSSAKFEHRAATDAGAVQSGKDHRTQSQRRPLDASGGWEWEARAANHWGIHDFVIRWTTLDMGFYNVS